LARISRKRGAFIIIEVHRPVDLEKAFALLQRTTPKTVPLGGGSDLNSPIDEDIAVVDVKALGLNTLETRGSSTLVIGAATTLQTMSAFSDLGIALKTAIVHEADHSLRRTATIAGSMVSADGRSPFACAMLAMDAQLTLLPDEEIQSYGDILPFRTAILNGRLITSISIPLNLTLQCDYVPTHPNELPVVIVAVARWPSGRIRVIVGGWGDAPRVALDGLSGEGAIHAVGNAMSHGEDQRATAKERVKAGQNLLERLMAEESDA